MDDDNNEISQQPQFSCCCNSNNQYEPTSKFANDLIEEPESSQAQYLYLDPNFITQAIQTNTKTPYTCDNNKNYGNYSTCDVPQITENAENFKALLREVALTTNVLYKTFKKAYHKSRNESLDYSMDCDYKMRQSRPATTNCNKEIIGDVMMKCSQLMKSKTNSKSNKNNFADVYIEPFTVTIPLKLLVGLGSKATHKRHKSNYYIAGRHSAKKHANEQRTASMPTSRKYNSWQMPYKRMDTTAQTHRTTEITNLSIKSSIISTQNSDIFLSCVSSEDVVYSTIPSTAQVRETSDIVQPGCSSKFLRDDITILPNTTEQNLKAPVIAQSSCTCRLRKENFPNLSEKNERVKSCNTRQTKETNYPSTSKIFTTNVANEVVQNVAGVCDKTPAINVNQACSKKPVVPVSALFPSQEVQNNFIDLTQLEKDTEQSTSTNLPTDDTAQLNDATNATTPQPVNFPTELDTIEDNEIDQTPQQLQAESIQKQVENMENVPYEKVSGSHVSMLAIESTSAPDTTQPDRLSLQTNLELMEHAQDSDFEGRLQTEDYEKQLENLENQTSANQENIRKDSPIKTDKTTSPDHIIEQIFKPSSLDAGQRQQSVDTTEKVARKSLGIQVQEESVAQPPTIPENEEELPPNKRSNSTQTDIPSFRGHHAQRVILRKQILDKLCNLVIPNEISNRSHLTAEQRNIILQDLWKVFSLDTLPTLQDDDINIIVVDHIKYLLAYLPKELRHDVPTEFEITDDPNIKAIIDDLRHILYVKSLLTPGHFYSKENAETILRSLNDLLQSHSSADTPLDQKSRESLIHTLKRLLTNSSKDKEHDNNQTEQTAVNMNIPQKLDSSELSEEAYIQQIDVSSQKSVEAKLMEKPIELQRNSEQISLNLNVSKNAIAMTDLNYEPSDKHLKIDECPLNVGTNSSMASNASNIHKNTNNTPNNEVLKDNRATEMEISAGSVISGITDYKNKNTKNFRLHEDKDEDNDFSPVQHESPSIYSYPKPQSYGFRKSLANTERRSVLPSYIPPTDYGVPRERWKPNEDFRPFNKPYEKTNRIITDKTSLETLEFKLNSPLRREDLSFENLYYQTSYNKNNVSSVDSEISAYRLPRIRRLSKDDLNLNNEIKSNILNASSSSLKASRMLHAKFKDTTPTGDSMFYSKKSNDSPKDILRPEPSIPSLQSEITSSHSVRFNNIEAESEIWKILEILKISSVERLKSANTSEVESNISAKVSSITSYPTTGGETCHIENLIETEEFDECEHVEEIDEIEYAISEEAEFSQNF